MIAHVSRVSMVKIVPISMNVLRKRIFVILMLLVLIQKGLMTVIVIMGIVKMKPIFVRILTNVRIILMNVLKMNFALIIWEITLVSASKA